MFAGICVRFRTKNARNRTIERIGLYLQRKAQHGERQVIVAGKWFVVAEAVLDEYPDQDQKIGQDVFIVRAAGHYQGGKGEF